MRSQVVASAVLLLFGMEHASIGAATTHEARVALLEAQVAMLNAQKQRPAPALKAKAKPQPPPPPPPPSPWCWCFWPSETDTRSRRQQPPDATSLEALHAACANAHSMTGRRPSREADDEEQQEVSRLTVAFGAAEEPPPPPSPAPDCMVRSMSESQSSFDDYSDASPPTRRRSKTPLPHYNHHQQFCRCSPSSQSPPAPIFSSPPAREQPISTSAPGSTKGK